MPDFCTFRHMGILPPANQLTPKMFAWLSWFDKTLPHKARAYIGRMSRLPIFCVNNYWCKGCNGCTVICHCNQQTVTTGIVVQATDCRVFSSCSKTEVRLATGSSCLEVKVSELSWWFARHNLDNKLSWWLARHCAGITSCSLVILCTLILIQVQCT